MRELTLHGPPTREHDLDLGQLPRVLWRHKWIVVGTLVVGLVGAQLLIARLTPVYTASVQLMIAPEPQVFDAQAVAAALRGDDESTASEVYVLRSLDLALRVADVLKLDTDPEFNPLLVQPEPSWLQRVFGALGQSEEKPPQLPDFTPEQRRNLVANVLLHHLEAVPLGRSRVMSVTAFAGTPDKAALVANTVAQEYLASQVDTKRATTGGVNTWLTTRTQELEAEVREREAAIEDYRARTGLMRGANTERLSDEEASGLSTQLVLARAEGAVARARLGQVEKLLTTGKPAAVGDVLDAPLVRTLREQQATLRREIAQMGSDYGPLHPQMVAAQAQLGDANNAIKAEVSRLVQGLRNEAAVASAREGAIAGSLNALKRQNGRQSQGEVQLRALERDAASSRTLLETFLARSKETAAQSTHAMADARMISRAVPPLGPSFPNSQLLMVIAGAVALGAGLLLALLREGMDRTVRSRRGLEDLLGIDTLGALPLLRGPWWGRQQPARWVLRAPRSEYSEALRRMHTELLLENLGDPPRVVLFTSSLPSEGKTSTLLALGRLLAGTGRKVIAVDLNLRKPTLHTAAGIADEGGIGEWFDGTDEAPRQLYHDPLSTLCLLPAGQVRADPGILLASARFARLIGSLRVDFDVVLLDSSPVLAVVDAQILACLADTTVLLVREGRAPRACAAEAFALLTRARGIAPRVVLNAARQHEVVSPRGYGLDAYYADEVPRPVAVRQLLGPLPMSGRAAGAE